MRNLIEHDHNKYHDQPHPGRLFLRINIIIIVMIIITAIIMIHLPPSLLDEHAPVWTAGDMRGEESSQAELQEGHLVILIILMVMI